MAEILTCAGFFLIYFIEKCVHFFMDSGVSDESRQIHRSFRCGFQASLIDRNEAGCIKRYLITWYPPPPVFDPTMALSIPVKVSG